MKLGERIKELRKQRHLTQRQLANMTGLHFTYLSKIENERLEYAPSAKTIHDLANALEADELELLELAGKIPPSMERTFKDKDAVLFFRRATQTIHNPQVWKELLQYLEKRTENE